ncbi:MAG: CPBP family intramembrane glutamic endopeptidase [Aeromicrobium sp.]
MTPWLRPTPAGRPYQQLARTDVHRWWRPLVGLLLMTVLLVVGGLAFILGLELISFATAHTWLEFGTGEHIFANDLADLMATLGTIVVLLPAVWIVVLVVDRRGIGTLASVARRIRWRWLAWCFLPAIAYMAAVYGASFGADALGIGSNEADTGSWVGWHAFWPPLLVIALLVPFQAAAEEYVFRGWILQAVGSFTFEGRQSRVGRLLGRVFGSAWPAIILSAIPFVLGHGYTDWGPADIGAFAVATGWVVVLTGGLEAGIALHIVNNVTSMSLDAAEGDVSLVQGAVPWTDVVVDVVPLALWIALVVWLFRHTGSKRPMKRLS